MNMGCNNFQSNTDKDLRQFLKERKVIFSEQRKTYLDECVRTVINLTFKKKRFLPNINTLQRSSNISILSPVGISQ